MDTERRDKRGLDYYGILGLTKSANDLEIKEAYRSLSIKYNPIRNKCSDAKMHTLFSLVGEAYEVLSKPLLKCIYDQYGEAGLKGGVLTVHGVFPAWQYTGGPYQTFKNFYNMPNPYANIIHCMQETLESLRPKLHADTKRKQAPIEQDLELTLEEIYMGTMKNVKIKRRRFDKDQIVGYEEEKIMCVRIRPGTPNGTKIVFKSAGDEGPTVSPGGNDNTEDIIVGLRKKPVHMIAITAEGDSELINDSLCVYRPGMKCPGGDLIIRTRDIPHPRFRREGVDLYMNIDLQIHRALADLTVEVTTLDCRVIRVAITEVITPGYQKIIPNEGFPYVDDIDKKGNLILSFDVKFPKYLSENARKKVLEALLSASGESSGINIAEHSDVLAKMSSKRPVTTREIVSLEIEEDPCEKFDHVKENVIKI